MMLRVSVQSTTFLLGLSLLLSAIFVSSSAISQITITDADMPAAGDVFFLDSAVPDLTIDLSQTGANQQWDFSNLSLLTSDGDTFIAADDLPLTYGLFFLSSNLAEKSALSFSSDLITLEDIYTVYKKSSSQYQIDGYAGTFSGIPLPVVYASKDVVYRFPLNYGNTDSADADVAFSIPGLVYFSQERHRVNEVDGWGTVTTPVGIYDVLRVKSTITDVDSFYVDTLGGGYQLTVKSYEYKWLAANKGIPVLQINATDVAGIPVISQILYQDTALQSGIKEPTGASTLQIVPNPAADVITMKFNSDLPSPYIIYNAAGAVMTSGAERRSAQLDVSKWPSGIYRAVALNSGRLLSSSFVIAR
jgi:hypothetical protein